MTTVSVSTRNREKSEKIAQMLCDDSSSPKSSKTVVLMSRHVRGNGDNSHLSCSVCHVSPLRLCQPFVNSCSSLSICPSCRSVFHFRCLKAWLVKSNTCPNCRYTVDTFPSSDMTCDFLIDVLSEEMDEEYICSSVTTSDSSCNASGLRVVTRSRVPANVQQRMLLRSGKSLV